MSGKECKDYKEDDWGECNSKFNPDIESCKDNCLKYPTEKFKENYKRFILEVNND